MPAPDKLPADFDFSKQGPPDKLPANFDFGGGQPKQPENAGYLQELWKQADLPGIVKSLKEHPAETVANAIGGLFAPLNPNFTQSPQGQAMRENLTRSPQSAAAALTLGGLAMAPAAAGPIAEGLANAGKYVAAGAKAGTPGVLGGLAKAGAGEVLAKIPGMELPARFGLQYPALRQISKAIEKGHEAGMAAVKPSVEEATAAAPRPVRASKAPPATPPPAPPPPEVPPTGPGKTAADLLNEEMGTKEAAPPVTAKAPGQTLAESHGETWSKLREDDKLAYAQLEGAQASSEARNAAAPSAYTPRPPEYYGVKAAEAPPTNPAPSAPAPAPAPAAPTPASAAPPAAEPTPKPIYHATRQPEHAVKILQSGKILPAGGGSTGVNFVSTTTQPLKNYSQAPAVFELDPTKVQTQPFDFFANRPQMINGEPVPGTGGGLTDPRFEFEHRAPGAIPTSAVKAVHINPSLEAEDAASIKAAADKAGIPVKEGGVFSPEAPQPKPASGAANAKSARYADAISKWAKDMGMSPKDIADQWGTTTPEVRGQILLQLKQKGYLGANETIPRTSAQGIVDALKARAATIKPPKGFSLGEMATKH